MAFSWLFRGPHRLGVFRGFFVVFFVAFPWLFRGPHFGEILRVLALEKSSELPSHYPSHLNYGTEIAFKSHVSLFLKLLSKTLKVIQKGPINSMQARCILKR